MNPTLKLTLVRHGLTEWNLSRRFQGHADVPLNNAGRLQAEALAKRLAGEQLCAIYTSDLQRAQDTAQEIANVRRSAITAEPRLREISFGVWEGLTYAEICQKTPAALANWEANTTESAPPGGETLARVAARVRQALDEIRRQHAGENVLVVAHAGSLQVLLCLALDISPGMYWQFHLAPGSISEISLYPAGAMINVLNDTCHLNGESI